MLIIKQKMVINLDQVTLFTRCPCEGEDVAIRYEFAFADPDDGDDFCVMSFSSGEERDAAMRAILHAYAAGDRVCRL